MNRDDTGSVGAKTLAPVAADLPKTLSVPVAGRRYFDMGRNASYEAARRGELPVIRFGRRLRVPVIALERMLVEASSIPIGALHGQPRFQDTHSGHPFGSLSGRREGRREERHD